MQEFPEHKLGTTVVSIKFGMLREVAEGMQYQGARQSSMHVCYPFDLCYSKCRISTDRIKQRSRV